MAELFGDHYVFNPDPLIHNRYITFDYNQEVDKYIDIGSRNQLVSQIRQVLFNLTEVKRVVT